MRRKTNTRVMAWMLVLTLSLGLTSTAFAASMGVVRMPTKDGSVYLRSGGGTKYPPIGYANHGDLLKILSEGRNWDRVTMTSGVGKGKTGWMSNKYITNLKDVTDMSGWGASAHIKTKYAASTVNLRKGPGTSYGVKDSLHRDDMLIILDKYNSKWYEVQVVNSLRTGYVHKDYIANGATGVTTANLNLRKKASTSAGIRLVIPQGDNLTVLNVGKKWSKVRYNNVTGYVWNGYIRLA